jgi:aminoglycoside 6'-N-acetyltransferase
MQNVELNDYDEKRHFALIASWLDRPHVNRWWGDSEHNLSKVHQRLAITGAIIAVDRKPVGCLCWQTPSQAELKEANLDELPNDIVDVDIMIGESDSLGQGVGPEALRLLFERLRVQGVSLVGVAAAVSNKRALKAYEKVGLRPFRDFIERGDRYRYLTKKLIKTAQQ